MLLQLQGMKKYFPVRRSHLHFKKGYLRAVDNIDLTIAAGENVGLVGESGSGKTTLARLILKLLPLDGGRIMLEGEDITFLSARRMRPYRQFLQMVFQDPYSSLDPRYTIRGILGEAMIFEDISSQEKEKRIGDLLAAVGLKTNILDRYPHEFSGGERQRLAIARALVMRPKLLILDEAVSSLDVLIQEQIIRLLSDIQKKFHLTYLFITHNLRVVKRMSVKIAVMYQGKIVEYASAEEIFRHPLHPYTQELLSAAIDYKVSPRSKDITIPHNARLIDTGAGHWLMVGNLASEGREGG